MSGIPTAWSNLLTDTSASDTIGLGSIRMVLNKIYKWVQYSVDDAIAAVAGQAVYYLIAAYETSIVTCDLSAGYGSSGAKGIHAGVLVSAPTDNQYCWIQIKGPCMITTNAAAGAAGDAMTAVGGNDKGIDVSAAVTDANTAIMTTTTSGAQLYILDCPF